VDLDDTLRWVGDQPPQAFHVALVCAQPVPAVRCNMSRRSVWKACAPDALAQGKKGHPVLATLPHLARSTSMRTRRRALQRYIAISPAAEPDSYAYS
jgi:hypothetical protein